MRRLPALLGLIEIFQVFYFILERCFLTPQGRKPVFEDHGVYEKLAEEFVAGVVVACLTSTFKLPLPI